MRFSSKPDVSQPSSTVSYRLSTQSDTLDGDLHQVGVETDKTQEEETSRTTCLRLLWFRASLHRCRARWSMLFLTSETPTTTSMLWFNPEGRSNTTTAHFLCLDTLHPYRDWVQRNRAAWDSLCKRTRRARYTCVHTHQLNWTELDLDVDL